MKNKILLFCLAIWGLNTSKAQISIHPQLGVSMNTIKDFDAGSYSDIGYLFGFQGGAGFDFKLGDLVSIEPILRYTQKGYKIESSDEFYPGLTISETVKLRLHYLELPVMVNFNTEVGDLNLVYSVGPYLGYCTAARLIDEQTDGTDTRIYDSKNDENFLKNMVDNGDFNRFDFGLNLGVNAEISNFTFGFSGAMSGQTVFGDFLKDANKHLNFQFNAGYKIELD